MLKTVFAITAGLFLAAPAGWAQGKFEDQKISLVKQLQTSMTLYEIGLAARDPLYVLAAARLRKAVALNPVDRAPDGKLADSGTPLSWQAMLDAAGDLVGGDPVLEGLADDIRAETSKGVANGPVYSIVEIRGGGRDVYPGVPFSGGEYAEVYIEGPSGVDLNLMIRDAKGRLVCSDTDISAIAYCGWRPAESDAFEISVVNESAAGGRYSMITN